MSRNNGLRGRKLPQETKDKISKSLSNEKHFNWKEDANYGIVHYWLRRNFIKRNICEICKKETKCDWALMKGCTYKRKRDNFMELCRACHIVYDGKKFREKPCCIDCGKTLTDWNAKRCQSHAQKERYRKNV